MAGREAVPSPRLDLTISMLRKSIAPSAEYRMTGTAGQTSTRCEQKGEVTIHLTPLHLEATSACRAARQFNRRERGQDALVRVAVRAIDCR